MFDHTTSGSTLKWLSIVDEYTRECLALKVDRSIASEDVIDTLAELFAMRGVPRHICSDNGPEFIARAIQRWLCQVEVQTLYVARGSPWENGFAESFHSRLRDKFLALEEFESLAAARKLTAVWREDYNYHRPHSSLGYVTPVEFAARWYPHNTWYRNLGLVSPLAAGMGVQGKIGPRLFGLCDHRKSYLGKTAGVVSGVVAGHPFSYFSE